MPRSFSHRFRLFYFFLFVLVFLIGFPILVFYSAGYTWDETFGISARGGIYVFTPDPGTSVFIGNELKNTSSFFSREVLISDLRPSQYLVLATNESYWPWAKLVEVTVGEVEALNPLLVPKVIDAEEVAETATIRGTLTALFATSTISSLQIEASTSTPHALAKKNVKIWFDGTRLFAQWRGNASAVPKHFCSEVGCLEPVQIFEAFVPIRSIDFYPNRDDAIILALDNGVYVIETDRRPTQNFYPLYRGQNPDFRIYRNQVYIQDENYIALLNI